MLPAANRLRTAADFTDTTRRGAKVARGSVVVYVAVLADSPEPPRIGLVVGKSVGGSVTRHRAARRIRGAVSPLVAALPDGCRVVIRALPGADSAAELTENVAAGVRAGLERTRR